jgi:ABC-2 type transport system permease protein
MAASASVVGRHRVRGAWRSYSGVTAIAIRQGLTDRGALLGRLAFYAVILLIFSRLWEVVALRGAIPGVTMRELLWYLAITEWVMLSLPPIHLRIEADVRSGDIAYHLPRPISYLGSRLAEEAGEVVLRLVTLGVAGCVLAFVLGGGLPANPGGLLLCLPLGILASWVGLCFHAAIGLTSFWLQDCSPVYWIWQKAAFILGGLLVPLEIYPTWLRELAMWTPFSALMHGPGRMAFGWQPELAAWVAAKLVFWGILATVLVTWTYRRGLRVMDVNGG